MRETQISMLSSPISDPQVSLKFVLVGDSTVGKTSLCKHYCELSFDEQQTQTIGLEFGRKVVEIDGVKVKIQIWDTAGQERFRSITKAYFRSSSAVCLVFDVTSRASFTSIASWVEDANNFSPPQSIKVLIANKIDLQDRRQISTAEAQEFALQNELRYYETSAKTGENIEDTFMENAREIYKKMMFGKIEARRPTIEYRKSVGTAPKSLPKPDNSDQTCC